MLDFNNVITITLKELKDARRNRWYLIYVIVFAGLSLALAWLGMTGIGDYGLAGFGRPALSDAAGQTDHQGTATTAGGRGNNVQRRPAVGPQLRIQVLRNGVSEPGSLVNREGEDQGRT